MASHGRCSSRTPPRSPRHPATPAPAGTGGSRLWWPLDLRPKLLNISFQPGQLDQGGFGGRLLLRRSILTQQPYNVFHEGEETLQVAFLRPCPGARPVRRVPKSTLETQ